MMEIVEYNATEAGLAELKEKMAGNVYEVTTRDGMALAKADRRELVTLRTTLEAKRKELKAPALERCRLIDAEAASIKEQILELETPIDKQIKEEEQRIKEERERKEEEARQRDLKIMETIAKMQSITERTGSFSAEKLAECIAYLEDMQITEEAYGSFLQTATDVRDQAIIDLNAKREQKLEEEAEAERLEQERIAKEEEERIEREKAQKELEAKQEALRKEQEEFAAQKAAQEAEWAKEQERLAAQKAEQEEADRLIREEEEKKKAVAAEEKRIADEKEAERLKKEAAESEKKRKASEAKARKLAREKKLADAKCNDATAALTEILRIATDGELSYQKRVEQIEILAEANI